MSVFRNRGWTDIGLRANDPAPTYDNVTPKDLVFGGRPVVEVEEYWSTAEVRGTRFEYEIVNRLAVYRKRRGGFVAEALRYNPRVLLAPMPDEQVELPFMSRAREFASQEEAVTWLRSTEICREGDIARKLGESLAGRADHSSPAPAAGEPQGR